MKKGLRAERKGLLLSFLTLGLVGSLAVIPMQFRSTATVKNQESAWRTESHASDLENYDIRTDKSSVAREAIAGFRASAGKNSQAIAAERKEFVEGENQLRARVPSLKVEYNEDIRIPEVIAPEARLGRTFLTGANSGSRAEVLRSFVKSNNDLVGMTDDQIEQLKVTANYTNPDGNLSFAHLQQTINGIPVFRGEIKAGFTKQGEIIRVINNLAPDLDYSSLSTDFGAPEDAVQAAFKNVSRQMRSEDMQKTAAVSSESKVTFGSGDWATTAEKMYFPVEPGVASPAWWMLGWQGVGAY